MVGVVAVFAMELRFVLEFAEVIGVFQLVKGLFINMNYTYA